MTESKSDKIFSFIMLFGMIIGISIVCYTNYLISQRNENMYKTVLLNDSHILLLFREELSLFRDNTIYQLTNERCYMMKVRYTKLIYSFIRSDDEELIMIKEYIANNDYKLKFNNDEISIMFRDNESVTLYGICLDGSCKLNWRYTGEITKYINLITRSAF